LILKFFVPFATLYADFCLEAQACLKLAIPIAISHLSQAALSVVDAVMMGWLGNHAFAAGSLGNITFSTLYFVGIGLLEGVSALGAEAVGMETLDRPDRPEMPAIDPDNTTANATSPPVLPSSVSQVASQGMGLAFILSIPVALLLAHLSPLLRLLGQPEDLISMVQPYLQAVSWGFPAALGFFVLAATANVLNRPQWMTMLSVISVGLNAIANYLLMFGLLGFPELGLAGIGWGTTIVLWFDFTAALAFFAFHPDYREHQVVNTIVALLKKTLNPGFQPDRTSVNPPQPSLWPELLNLGWPVGLQYCTDLGLFLGITLLMSYLGTVTLAANEIALQMVELLQLFPIGLTYAALCRVGTLQGGSDSQGVLRAGWVSIFLGITTTSLMALVLWPLSGWIPTLYLDATQPDNQAIIHVAARFLKVIAVFQVLYNLHLIVGGILLGLKDTRIPMLIYVASGWGIGAGGGYLVSLIYNWRGIDLWLDFTIAIILATALLIFRFYQLTKPTTSP
jgi:MATE family multidrug resistance protein